MVQNFETFTNKIMVHVLKTGLSSKLKWLQWSVTSVSQESEEIVDSRSPKKALNLLESRRKTEKPSLQPVRAQGEWFLKEFFSALNICQTLSMSLINAFLFFLLLEVIIYL
jgi:hypothetical protein